MTSSERKRVVERQWAVFLDTVKTVEVTTGRPSDDVAAMLIAEGIKAASIDLEWAKQALRNWPALASPMLTYLPNAAWLKEIVDRGQTPRKRKSYDKYHADAEVTVGAAQARHRGFKQKVDNGTATDFDHLMEITTDAEAAACEHHLGARDPVQRRIFERQLNAMVWFQCLLMTPGAGMTDPREDGEPTLKQRRREQERDESFSAY